MKKYLNFLSEIFHFLVVKFSAYLNKRVFVMIVAFLGHLHYYYSSHDNIRFSVNDSELLASVAQLDARPTGDQEVAGSTPAEVGNFLSWRLLMTYFLRSFSPFR